MSRRNSGRINIDRSLEKYLDDLWDELLDAIDAQQRDSEDAIAALNLNENNLYQIAANVFETFVLDDDIPERDALGDAVDLTVNASIYSTLKRDRRLRDIPKDLEDDLYDDLKEVDSILENYRDDRRDRGGSRNDRRSRDQRGSRSGRRGDGRRDMATDNRRDRDRDDNQRRGRDRDNGRDRDERNDAAKIREERRNKQQDEAKRDQTVATAKEEIDRNKKYPITVDFIKENPDLFSEPGRQLLCAPVYFLGSQLLEAWDGKITVKDLGSQDVEWEKHRTDLYLKVRSNIKPSVNLRTDAINRAANARQEYIKEVLQEIKVEDNVVTERKPIEIKQCLFSREIISNYYGNGKPLDMVRHALDEIGLSGIPAHPAIVLVERMPMWVMDVDLTDAVERLINCQRLSDFMNLVIDVQNKSNDEQWAYFHDRLTYMVNSILRIEMAVNPYVESVVTEWNDLAKYLEKFKSGELVTFFTNELKKHLPRTFHIHTVESPNKHVFVTGEEGAYAGIGYTANLIYIPVSSENFAAASATKLGRVMEGVTENLYKLLERAATDVSETLLITSSNESINVYYRETATKQIIHMGDLIGD